MIPPSRSRASAITASKLFLARSTRLKSRSSPLAKSAGRDVNVLGRSPRQRRPLRRSFAGRLGSTSPGAGQTKTAQEIENAVIAALIQIAPEAVPSQIDPTVSLREQLDIDSMDFLNFVIALYKQFHVDIPENDYPRLSSLKGCVEYLSAALRSRQE